MPGLVGHLRESRLDVIHTHGLWMYPSVAAMRWARGADRPYVVSPHGMLDPWALGNARFKKRLAALLYEKTHLRGAACLHALCESEVRAIRAIGLENPVCVLPNGVDLPDSERRAGGPVWGLNVPSRAHVLLYVGRLHPKKGLLNLLAAWADSRRNGVGSGEPWFLVIAGWDQSGHREVLEGLAVDLGISDFVHFVGPQFGADKAASFARADALVLPSLSEGLPMVVLEGWAYGLPVLMTPACNLPAGFSAGAAVSAEPERESLQHGLATLLSMSDEDRSAMGNRGRRLVEQSFSWPVLADEMHRVYRWLTGAGERPSCVVAD